MKPKEILVFGASGQIGRHLIRKLTKNNYKVTAVTRNLHHKGIILKTQANPGYLDIVEIKSFEYERISNLIKKSNIVINLVGILFEKKNGDFRKIHSLFPSMLAEICKKHNIDQLVHISALGVDKVENSKYALSKTEGEKKVRETFSRAVILKPSIVYSVDDKFTTRFMTLLSLLPLMPIYYEGKTKFSPIHVSDLSNIIFQIINMKVLKSTIECVGPEILSFKEILNKLLKSINKNRILLPLPYTIAKLSAKIFQLFPKPLLTVDQLNLLKYDNIQSGNFQTNNDLNISAKLRFDEEVKKYSFNWTRGGQYAKK
tara:strand:- start:568 stop:1512 length:945 start_codon:yes stop_codon:yes gene_type:complete